MVGSMWRVCALQHLSISNGSTQVDASFMQTLWNIQPTCSSGNMAVGEEPKRAVCTGKGRMCGNLKWTPLCLIIRVSDRWTRDASLSRPRRELDHTRSRKQWGDAEVRRQTQHSHITFSTMENGPNEHPLVWILNCAPLCTLRIVNYEAGKGASKARSLWRLEPLRIRWV